MIFLLIGGLACILFPGVILSASGMSALEEDTSFIWIMRVLGVLFVGIAIWGIYSASHH